MKEIVTREITTDLTRHFFNEDILVVKIGPLYSSYIPGDAWTPWDPYPVFHIKLYSVLTNQRIDPKLCDKYEIPSGYNNILICKFSMLSLFEMQVWITNAPILY